MYETRLERCNRYDGLHTHVHIHIHWQHLTGVCVQGDDDKAFVQQLFYGAQRYKKFLKVC